MTASETHRHTLYIQATPEQIWAALTTSEWTTRYGYGGDVHFELEPGGAFRHYSDDAMRAHGAPDVVLDGEVLEADAPRRLVQTWRALFSEELAAEPPSTLTWELEPGELAGTKVTLTHELPGAPQTATMVGGTVPGTGGGWPYVISDLKTLLETGARMGPNA